MPVLLSTLKNKAATAVASQVSSFAKFGTSSGASAISALTGSKGFSSTTSKNLAYPINVEDDPEQGHYIIFYIYQIDDAKLAKKVDAATSVGSKDSEQINKELRNSDTKGMASQSGKGAGKSLSIKRPPMKKMDQAIALYMPPSVKVEYKSNYTDQEIGAIAQGAGDVYSALSSGQGLMSALGAGGGAVVSGMAAAAVKKAGNMVSGARAMAQIASGLAISNKMELQFEGVERRDFSYSFTFIPKSEQEAQIVEEIVYAFKKNMFPSYMDSVNLDLNPFMKGKTNVKLNGKIMKVPNIFDIEYQHKGKRNPFLNRVSSSYLTAMDVEYGGNRFKAYEPTSTNDRKGYEGGGNGPPPQRTTINLSFREIEKMSQERIEAGF